jgi:hypothetical protein
MPDRPASRRSASGYTHRFPAGELILEGPDGAAASATRPIPSTSDQHERGEAVEYVLDAERRRPSPKVVAQHRPTPHGPQADGGGERRPPAARGQRERLDQAAAPPAHQREQEGRPEQEDGREHRQRSAHVSRGD